MGLALTTDQPPDQVELSDLYEVVNGRKVWPRVGRADSDRLWEVAGGREVEVPRMGALAAAIASFLVTHLNVYGWSQKRGFAVAEVLFQLLPGRPQRRPDVAFVSYEGWQPPPAEDPPAWQTVPLVAAEVVGPTNTVTEIQEKLEDYFAAGVRLVWVVYPVQRLIYAYESRTQVRILTEADELDGATALSGFRLPVASLFATLVKP
jgi:Uma2 family endonuclease